MGPINKTLEKGNVAQLQNELGKLQDRQSRLKKAGRRDQFVDNTAKIFEDEIAERQTEKYKQSLLLRFSSSNDEMLEQRLGWDKFGTSDRVREEIQLVQGMRANGE